MGSITYDFFMSSAHIYSIVLCKHPLLKLIGGKELVWGLLGATWSQLIPLNFTLLVWVTTRCFAPENNVLFLKVSLICAKKCSKYTAGVTPSLVQSVHYSNNCQNGECGMAAVPTSRFPLASVISTWNNRNDTFTLKFSGPFQVIIIDVWIYFPFTETQWEFKATYKTFHAQSKNLDTNNT